MRLTVRFTCIRCHREITAESHYPVLGNPAEFEIAVNADAYRFCDACEKWLDQEAGRQALRPAVTRHVQ